MKRVITLPVLLALSLSALACIKEVERVVEVTPTEPPAPTRAQPAEPPVATSTPSTEPQPGAVFRGETSQGFTIQFAVSPDGNGISRYEFTARLNCGTNPLPALALPLPATPSGGGVVAPPHEAEVEGRTEEGHLLREWLSEEPDGSFRYRTSLEEGQVHLAPITARGFAAYDTLSGTFVSDSEAEGTLRVRLAEWSCDSGEISWRAEARA